MSLDLFDTAIRDADNEVARSAAPALPVEFSEALKTSWDYVANFRAFEAESVARSSALSAYGDDVHAKTGERLNTLGLADGLITLDEFNAEQAKLKEKYPGLDYLTPLSEQDVTNMTNARMARAYRNFHAMDAREKTWGGSFGAFLGQAAEGVAGVQAPLMALGGAGEVSIGLRALEFAGLAAGGEALAAVGSGAARERAVPGSASEIPGDIISAGLFGAGLGGAFGLLGKFLAAGSRKLPTSVVDDLNAGGSEAQLNAANVFPGAGGEAANRDAVIETINQILRGENVVSGERFNAAHITDLAETAGAKDSAELSAAADRAQRPVTHDVAPDVEVFDRVPNAMEDAASYWDDRLAAASPEERAALGATDDVRARDLAPEDVAKLAADPQTEEAVQRNLDRLRLEDMDREFTMGVRQADGSVQMVTRKLEDVLDEIDGFERAGKELLGCVIGAQAAE
jgi:hypothetical protein